MGGGDTLLRGDPLECKGHQDLQETRPFPDSLLAVTNGSTGADLSDLVLRQDTVHHRGCNIAHPARYNLEEARQ